MPAFAVFILGLSAMVTQLVLMRELMCVFSGNEMVLGIVLGNWLLLTGLGAAIGRFSSRLRRPAGWLAAALILLALLPIADVFALRTLRNIVFVRGAMIGLTHTVAACFLLLLPYCLISGWTLTCACGIVGERQAATGIARVYLLDSLGMIAGGGLLALVLLRLTDHFVCLAAPGILSLVCAGALAWRHEFRIIASLALLAACGLVALMFTVNLDEYATRIEYAGFRVVHRGNSPYGRLIVTESGHQLNFIENGVPLFSTDDAESVEETVHYAMAQRPGAKRVLLIGGGISGTARDPQVSQCER